MDYYNRALDFLISNKGNTTGKYVFAVEILLKIENGIMCCVNFL